eukprot:1370264-Rhodomonas_salina.1
MVEILVNKSCLASCGDAAPCQWSGKEFLGRRRLDCGQCSICGHFAEPHPFSHVAIPGPDGWYTCRLDMLVPLQAIRQMEGRRDSKRRGRDPGELMPCSVAK